MSTSSEAVDVQTAAFITCKRKTIGDAVARYIASAWHGGQSSALYAFASSGGITDVDALRAEIARNADSVSSNPDAYGEDSDDTEYARLIALDGYVSRWKRTRKPVAGWHTLWP